MAEALGPGWSSLQSDQSRRLPLGLVPAEVWALMEAGEPVFGLPEELPLNPQLHQTMARLSVRAIIAVPLRVAGELWGLIGFHDCTQPRRWDSDEVLLLRMAAELISGALRRWRDDDELRRREELLHTLFEILPVAIAITDSERRPLRVNHAMEQIVGLDAATIMAGAYRSLIYSYPDGSPMSFAEFPGGRALAGVTIRNEEVGLLRPDGQRRWLAVSAAPIPLPGLGVAVVSVDITERKQAEEERRTIERKLQEGQRLESLGLLAGGVAHDFNNILAAILGHAELARMDLPPAGEAAASLDAIVMGARRAADLTAQMLAYAGRGQVLSQPVSLNQAVAELRDLTRPLLPSGVLARYNLGPGLPLLIADGTQLRQVLLNLLTNAAEAVAAVGGGTITVTTGRAGLTQADLEAAIISAAAPGPACFVEVSDTGCGMDEPTLRRIFDPFFSTKFTGRGLGLAAVHGIVLAHQGALVVQSTPGRGSVFRVYFPVAEQPALALNTPNPQSNQL